MNYYTDFVLPNKKYAIPTEEDKKALGALFERLRLLAPECPSEDIQKVFYDIATEFGPVNMRIFFSRLYALLLGQPEGPRWGSFVSLYGVDKTIVLIEIV